MAIAVLLCWHFMEARSPITKMFPWLQIRPQSAPFLLIIRQLPKIHLAVKTGKLTVWLPMGLSLLVRYIHSLQSRSLQEATSARAPDLPIKAVSKQICCLSPNSCSCVLGGFGLSRPKCSATESTTKYPEFGCS